MSFLSDGQLTAWRREVGRHISMVFPLSIIHVKAGPPVDQKVVGSVSLRSLILHTKGTAGQMLPCEVSNNKLGPLSSIWFSGANERENRVTLRSENDGKTGGGIGNK